MSCPDCFRGGKTLEHPKGREATVHGLQTYIATPPAGTTPKGVILFATDAFGWQFPNNRVLADHYASRGGYLVYVPDFMGGRAIPAHGLELMDRVMGKAATWADALWKPWYVLQMVPHMVSFTWHCSPGSRKGLVFDFARKLKESPPPAELQSEGAADSSPVRVGVAGFCWGGKMAVWLAAGEGGTVGAEGKPLVDCVFTAHPSFMSVPDDFKNVKLPLSVAIGDTDMAMSADKIQLMKKVLEGKNSGSDSGDRYEVNILPGAVHGFAVRSHPQDQHEMECARRAEDQAIAWFDKWLARG